MSDETKLLFIHVKSFNLAWYCVCHIVNTSFYNECSGSNVVFQAHFHENVPIFIESFIARVHLGKWCIVLRSTVSPLRHRTLDRNDSLLLEAAAYKRIQHHGSGVSPYVTHDDQNKLPSRCNNFKVTLFVTFGYVLYVCNILLKFKPLFIHLSFVIIVKFL